VDGFSSSRTLVLPTFRKISEWFRLRTLSDSLELFANVMRLFDKSAIWAAVKKLGLGFGLIAFLSTILLLTDLGHRKSTSETSLNAGPQAASGGHKFKVALVYLAPSLATDLCVQGLLDGLQAGGITEEKNLELVRGDAQGEMINIPAILQNYDNADVDLILTVSTPCLTGACNRVKHKPVVFTCVSDPIAAGVGTSQTEHLPFLTGVGSFPAVSRNLGLMQKLVPGLRAVGAFYNPAEANSVKEMSVAREVYRSRGVKLEEVTVSSSNEVLQAVQILAGRGIQVVWAPADNIAIEGYEGAVKGAQDAKLPLIADICALLPRGGLACSGFSPRDSGLAAGKLAAKVLRGANPKDLPVEEVAVEQTFISKSNAEKLNVTIPQEYSGNVRP
jgi:putative tryptophan/tyrosine transport system substrate-binding protein